MGRILSGILDRIIFLLIGVFMCDILVGIAAVLYFKIPNGFHWVSVQATGNYPLPLTILVIVFGVATNIIVIVTIVHLLLKRSTNKNQSI